VTESDQPRPVGANDALPEAADGTADGAQIGPAASLEGSTDSVAEAATQEAEPAVAEFFGPDDTEDAGHEDEYDDEYDEQPDEELLAGFAEPEPSTRVSPLARLRSTAHSQHLTTIERLRDGQAALSDRASGWLSTIVITVVAFAVRFYSVAFTNGSVSIATNLGYPNKLVFDETYYAKDAWTLWKFGYERAWPDRDSVDSAIAAGNVDQYTKSAEFVVHPPVGKWLIGFGEQIFGMNSFGWRFMPLIFGVLLVFITIRMARRLSRSTLIGAIAGILLTFDGLSFVMSRVALLDGFQAFFIVAAVSCVVADRDWYRRKLADHLEDLGVPDLGGRFGPIIWLRPWRLAAGVLFGLAIGTKWNSMFVLAAMAVLSVIWDVGARRLAGADFKAWLALVIDGIPAFVRLVVVAALVYVASWWGWLTTSGGWDRDWGENHPDSPLVKALGTMWASFIQYHKDIYDFHTGDYMRNVATHAYDAHPSGWLLMVRPIGIDAVNDIKPGTDGCPADATENCIRVISGMGTPILWWMAFIALLVAFVWWIGGRDWRFGVPIVAAMSTYIFWFPNADRPVFFFYAICIIPFTVTLLAMVMGLILGPRNGPNRRRGAIIVGVAIALVVVNFAYIYPLLTDGLLPYSQWLSRMWLRSWI
jgi:dolichyl-phosphate-mannose-protein mannosyltransferase